MALVTSVARVQCLAWELWHAWKKEEEDKEEEEVEKNEKKKKKEEGEEEDESTEKWTHTIRKCDASNFDFLSKCFFGYLGCFVVPYKFFLIFFFYFCKTCHWNLDRDCI